MTDGVDAGSKLCRRPANGRRSVRSRLWALILRELPFPFREIGTEIVRILSWIDKSAARIWLGFSNSPAWYLVTVMGTAAFVLTTLLFSNFVSSHDPTVVELARRSQKLVPTTREHLEEAGDWTAQDKWRLAHLFVDHRPPKRNSVRQINSRLVDDFPAFAKVPSRRDLKRRSGFNSRYQSEERSLPTANLQLPDPEVRLDLGRPPAAEEPKRLVYGPYVREPGADFHPVRLAANYRSRDQRLLVQAEWMTSTECDNPPFRGPARRPIPQPDPQWEDLPPFPEPIDVRHPDLSFQMLMLREFLPPIGQFPPRSRLESVSALSEFPETLDSSAPFRTHPRHESPWTRSRGDRTEQPPVESYADRVGTDDDRLPPIDDQDLRLGSASSFTEVALRLQLRAPESTVAGQVNQSSLTILNEGVRDIPLVTVRESLSGLETVTDAIPAARVDQFENALERQVQQLEPGKDQRMELVWRPGKEGKRVHSAIVTVLAAVGATTEIVPPVAEQPMPSVAPEPIPAREPEPEPEPPAVPEFRPSPVFEPEPIPEPEPKAEPIPEKHPGVSIQIQNLPRATVDDLVEIAIIVRNIGDVPLHKVRIVAQVPEHLKHLQGAEVEYKIDELPVRGTERTVLRAVAQSPGKATCAFRVAAEEPAEAKSKAIVTIEAKPVQREPIATRTVPPKPITVPKQPSPARPAIAEPACCCQSQPVELYEPWLIP